MAVEEVLLDLAHNLGTHATEKKKYQIKNLKLCLDRKKVQKALIILLSISTKLLLWH